MKSNRIGIVSLIIFLIAITASIFIQSYAFDKRAIGRDESSHFYDMKRHYESGKIPVTGARFIGASVQKEEFSTPRVPGGAFYIFYTFFYKLGGENLTFARFINLLFNFSIVLLFLFWCYKRFGALISSILSAFILCNPYIIMATTDFWNPNLTLIFSFILFICLYEYIAESKKIYGALGSIFAFPILAIMAQGHFVTFFTMIPTLIVYLMLNYNKTKKYIGCWALGVFISFLLYLPYLISELQSGFSNLNLSLGVRDGLYKLPFPQLHALFIYPTNEMSVFFGTRLSSILHFWLSGEAYFIGLPFLFLSIIFSIYCFVRAFVFLFKSKNISISKNEKIIKEFILIILIFVPITILSFIIWKSKSGTFHYLYSIFSISFSPLILFLLQIEYKIKKDNKKLYIFTSILVLNVVVMSGQIIRYINLYQEPRRYTAIKEVALTIKEDSKGKSIKIYNNFGGNVPYQYEDIFHTYFQEVDIKTTETNPDILYSIVDNIARFNWDKERNNKELEFLITNNSKVIYDSKGYTVYKFPKAIDF